MTPDDAASQRQHASDLADAMAYTVGRELSSPFGVRAAVESLIRAAALVEREACAKLVESMAPTEYVQRIAAAIRARR